jgi:hypothetical protein
LNFLKFTIQSTHTYSINSHTTIKQQSNNEQPYYGNKADNVHLSAADAEQINLSLFDEDDPHQHMTKIIYGLGKEFMLRGNEYASLLVSQVIFGNYPRSFEYQALAGHPYVALDNLLDKTCKVTVHNNYARQTSDILRIPIIEDDLSNLGASIKRLMPKLAPGQKRLFCKVASPDYIKSTYRRHGDLTSMFYPNCPLGHNKIKELIYQGAEMLGLPRNFRPHALRAVGVTKLANDSAISTAEVCRAARHSTASASKMYQTTDGRSEANRLKALGYTLPTEPVPVDTDAQRRTAEAVSRAQILNVPVVTEGSNDGHTETTEEKEVEVLEIVDVSAEAAACSSDNSACSDVSDIALNIHKKKNNKTKKTRRRTVYDPSSTWCSTRAIF